MLDKLFGFPQVIPVTLFCVIAATILAAAAMRTWRLHQAAKLEADLKLEMLARGMSAEEIERVLAAKATGSRAGVFCQR